jgi:hypothetical protein
MHSRLKREKIFCFLNDLGQKNVTSFGDFLPVFGENFGVF